MERKDFILILVALIIISGGYYLYVNNVWPFNGGSDLGIPTEISEKVFTVSAIAREVYDTVIILDDVRSEEDGGLGELMAVIGENTQIFRYDTSNSGDLVRVPLKIADISVGDRIALTSDEDIRTKQNGVFLASSIAVYK